MQAVILKPSERPIHDCGNGARTVPLVSRQCGSTSLINGTTEFAPGAAIGLHKHNCEESVLIVEGAAVAEIDGKRHHLHAGDTTWIPAGVPHRFINESDAIMKIFWTYATVDATRTMIETGVTQSIDAEQATAKHL
jgi:quercetin dioxygenase-like cupin family protein